MSLNPRVGGMEFGRGRGKRRTIFASEEDTADVRKMVDELLNVESGLKSYEIKMLDNIKDNWKGNLTAGQVEWITKIYIRVMK